MELTWLGKYRQFVGTLFRSANAYSQVCKLEASFGDTEISTYEIQIMEHILEYSDQHKNMSWYAELLGLSQSVFSKYVKKLVSKGLVEKYYLKGNKKNIVLMVSERGQEVYKSYSEYAESTWFRDFFDMLDTVPPDQLEMFEKIIGTWGSWFQASLKAEEDKKEEETELIKIE